MSLWESIEPLKQVIGFVIALVVIGLAYKFIDKWAAKFHDSMTAQIGALVKQADAMTNLATNQRTAHEDSREVLIVMRSMAQTLDDTRRAVADVQSRGGAQLRDLKNQLDRLEKERAH